MPSTSDEYVTDSGNIGVCLIISNIKFEGRLKTRHGGAEDERRLSEIFSVLGYHVELFKDCSAQDMLQIIKNTALKSVKTAHSSFVMCVLTHGTSDTLLGVDGKSLNLWNDVVSKFTLTNCARLAGKPKLLILHSCNTNAVESTLLEPETNNPEEWSDMLIMQLAPTFSMSLRSRSNGSPTVAKLCEILETYHSNLNVSDMMTLVHSGLCQTQVFVEVPDPSRGGRVEQRCIPVAPAPFLVDRLRKRFVFWNNLHSHPGIRKPSLYPTPKEIEHETPTCDKHEEVTVLPGWMETCCCDENGRLVMAANAHYNLGELLIHKREKDNTWITERLKVKLDHILESRCTVAKKIQVESMTERLLLIVLVHEPKNKPSRTLRSCLLTVSIATGDLLGVSEDFGTGCGAAAHLDVIGKRIWLPCKNRALVRKFTFPQLIDPPKMKVWRHHSIRFPWRISTNSSCIAVEDYWRSIYIFSRYDERTLLAKVDCMPWSFALETTSSESEHASTLLVSQWRAAIAHWSINQVCDSSGGRRSSSVACLLRDQPYAPLMEGAGVASKTQLVHSNRHVVVKEQVTEPKRTVLYDSLLLIARLNAADSSSKRNLKSVLRRTKTYHQLTDV